MTLSALELLSALLLPVLCGMGVLRLIGCRPEHDRVAYAGWAYMAGSFAVGSVVFVWLLLSLPLTARLLVPTVGVLGLACFALGLWIHRGEHGDRESAPVSPVSSTSPVRPVSPMSPTSPTRWGDRLAWLFRGLVVVLVGLTLLRVLDGALLPITEGDEARIYARRAQWLFHAGGFNQAFLEMASAFGKDARLDYPLLNPLLQIWTFALHGAVVHVENRLPIQLFAVALVLVLAGSLRHHATALWASILLLLFFDARLTNAFSRGAYADAMVALGLFCAVDAWLRWRQSGRPVWWRLSMLSSAFLVGSKNEGAFYLLAALLAGIGTLAIGALWPGRGKGFRRPSRSELAWVLLPVAALATTWGLNAGLGFGTYFTEGSALEGLLEDPAGRIRSIAGFFWKEWTQEPEHNNYLWAALFLVFLTRPVRVLDGETRFLSLFLLATVAGYFLVYMATPFDPEWQLQTSADRLFYQALPVVALAVGLQSGRVLYETTA